MEFNDEEIKEVVYIHKVERGFGEGNFIVVQEDFLMKKLELYASKHTAVVKEGWNGRAYNDHDTKRENILLPKGLIMRCDCIKYIAMDSNRDTGDNEICFSPLKKYNKNIESDIIAKKFKLILSELHGLKFHRISNVDMYLRKKKIESVLGS